jgi:hypothetical protein
MLHQACGISGKVYFATAATRVSLSNTFVRLTGGALSAGLYHNAMAKKPESLEQSAQSECLELLIEFLTGLQRIPQKYCLLCGAKTARRLDIGVHKLGCPISRASQLLSRFHHGEAI